MSRPATTVIAIAVAALAASAMCTSSADPLPRKAPPRDLAIARQESAMSPIDRYREFLRRQGVPPESARIVEEATLALGDFHCFRIEAAGREQRACVAPGGVVTGARAAGDAWWLLLAAGDARAIADRIAWLESTAGGDRHAPGQRIAVVVPADPPSTTAVDPELWRRAPIPVMRTAPDTRELVVWLYAAGADEPVERTVRAHPASAEIAERPAHEIVALGDPSRRAVDALGHGDTGTVQWALLVIARNQVVAAAPATAKLLEHRDARLRSAAASTLATLAAPASVDALAAAARRETDEVARIAEVQALGHIATHASARALSALRQSLTDPAIRVEAIHALGRIGDAAADDVRAALADTAGHDADANLRALAASYLQRLSR